MPQRRFILIAEDEPDTANLLQIHLQQRGYSTAVAADGFNALNLVFEGHPDLVILDLMLPKLHGFEVCRMLKASPSTREIPVLILTAMASTENKVQGFNAGAADYMTKPFEVAELLARIDSLMLRTPTLNP
ncbi:MAG TPA: response regulator [Verrucomicrobiae bacterium]|nr:response regulator [Verrucomicrobiae bacterium]